MELARKDINSLSIHHQAIRIPCYLLTRLDRATADSEEVPIYLCSQAVVGRDRCADRDKKEVNSAKEMHRE